ncbi:hypothetical protein SpCBS45565_g03788 [Spizellomyces sp. 'palustris']|nr:hypothetical protein SpCBS45565_g03788 [Spizellomyces sp. 'palustris']
MLRVESSRSFEGCTAFRRSESPAAVATWQALSRAIQLELKIQQEGQKPKAGSRYTVNSSFEKVNTELSSIEHAFDTQDGNKHVVLKRLNSPETAEHELAILRKINEANLPHVLRLRDTFEDSVTGERVLVFPELKRFDCNKLDLVKVAKYVKQLATGLKAAHAIGLAHLDLSISNLMLDENDDLVIIDWGLARFCDPAHVHPIGRGTPGYIAPEMYAGTATCTAPDIYSAGVIMGQWLEPYLIDCSLSYLGSKLVRSSTTSFITRKIQDHLDTQRIGYEDPWCPVVTYAAELLIKMFVVEPSRRITAAEIVQDPFVLAEDSEFEGTDFQSNAAALLRQSVCCGSPRDKPRIVMRYR